MSEGSAAGGGRARSIANLRPFQKGGDPRRNGGGRRKGLEALVAKQTNNGADLVAFFADVFYARGTLHGARVPLAVRMEAGTWLADRLWGRPKQIQEHTGDGGGPVTHEVVVRAVDYRASIRELRPVPVPVPVPEQDDGRSLPA